MELQILQMEAQTVEISEPKDLYFGLEKVVVKGTQAGKIMEHMQEGVQALRVTIAITTVGIPVGNAYKPVIDMQAQGGGCQDWGVISGVDSEMYNGAFGWSETNQLFGFEAEIFENDKLKEMAEAGKAGQKEGEEYKRKGKEIMQVKKKGAGGSASKGKGRVGQPRKETRLLLKNFILAPRSRKLDSWKMET